jgi:hypothetical protein
MQKVIAAQEQTLDLLGVPASWRQAKPPNATINLNVGMKTASWKDEELVNAYGINARVFTLKARDVSKLEKFDQITIGAERYTMDAAIPVYINGQLVFWKGIVRGD